MFLKWLLAVIEIFIVGYLLELFMNALEKCHERRKQDVREKQRD